MTTLITDLFHINPQVILEQGGLQPGGLNFDAKVRRESTDLQDIFIAHIGAMDTFARGLRNAAKIMEDGYLGKMLSVSSMKNVSCAVATC